MRLFRGKEDGLSVIELAVGIVIFLGVSVTVAAAVINASNNVAESTEVAYINNKLSIATQLIVREINDSKKIVESSPTSITLANENGGTTVITANADTGCSVTIAKYAEDANVLIDSVEAIDSLDSCNIFSATDTDINIMLSSTIEGATTFTSTAEAASGVYTETVDSGAFTPSALLAAPTNLAVAEPIGRNTVPLTWDPVTEALSYVVQISTDGTNWKMYDKYIIDGMTTVDGLRPSTPYSFRVAAKNGDGIGAYSQSVQATTLDGTLASEPTNIQTVTTPTTISVSWDLPVDNGGYGVYSYEYRYSADQTNWVTGTTVLNEATILNLKKNTNYYIQVAAINAKGTGSFGNAIKYPTKTDATAPTAPQNFTLDALATGSTIAASWSLPEDNGGVTELTYTIEKSSDGTNWTSSLTIPDLYASVTQVPKNSLVYVRVKANNAIGSSPWVSNSVQTPATKPLAPTNLITTELSAKTMTVSWTAPSSNDATGGLAIIGYKIMRDTNPNFTSPIVITNTGETSLAVSGLTRASKYYYRVYAINSLGESANYLEGNFTTLTAVPDAPILGASSKTYNSATIAWTPAADDGGTPVTGYNVYNGSTKVNATPIAAGTTTYTITGLTQLTTYNFYVTAINARGESAKQTLPITITTHPNPPSAPSNLVASNITQNSFTLSWTASTGVLDGYRIYKNNVLVNTTLLTSWDFTSLAAGTSYTIKIEAYNAGGQTSSTIAVVTKLGAVENLAAINTTTSGFRLTWTAPNSTGATKFVIYKGATVLAEVPSTQLYYDVTGLAANSRHTMSVRAANATTDSLPTEKIWSTQPVKPTGLTLLSKTDSTAKIQWNEDLTSNASFSKFYVYVNGALMGSVNAKRIAGDTSAITNQYTVQNLVEASSYEITVTEANDHAASDASLPLTVVTDFVPLTLTVDYAAETAVKVSWTGSFLSNIKYTVYLNGDLVAEIPAGMTKSYRFGGLEPATTYTVNVVGSITVGGVNYTSGDNTKTVTTATQPALPAGTVLLTANVGAPAGWELATGGAATGDLLAAIGATKPNFQGRTAVGIDSTGTIDARFDTLGETGGVKTVTLSTNEIPSHTHVQNAHNHTMPAHDHGQYSHNAGRPGHGHGQNSSFTISQGFGGGASGVRGGNSWWGCCGNAHWNLNYGATGSANGSGDQWSGASTASVNDRAANEVTNQYNGGSAAHTNLMPYTTLNYIIKSTNGASGNFVQRPGTIIMSMANTAPAGYILANGATVNTSAYPELAYALGKQQFTSFALPSLSDGEVVVGVNTADADFVSAGKEGGATTATISTAQMPRHYHVQDAHTHSGQGHTMSSPSHGHGDNGHGHGYNQYFTIGGLGGGGSSGIPNGSSWWGCCGSAHWYTPLNGNTDSNAAATADNRNEATPSLNYSTASNTNTGGGAAHENVQPYLVVKYYIKY